jgi:hypothetical protein
VRAVLAICTLKLPMFRYHITLATRTLGHMGKVGDCRRRSLKEGWWSGDHVNSAAAASSTNQ